MLNKLVLGSGYWYLATPYSRYEYGIELANEHACLIAAELMRRSIPVFAPIPHSHSIAINSGVDPRAHDFWMGVDSPLMSAAHGLILALMKGWRESRGMGEELDTFRAMRKPVVWLDPSHIGLQIPVDVKGVREGGQEKEWQLL